jgi:hypothetical protein
MIDSGYAVLHACGLSLRPPGMGDNRRQSLVVAVPCWCTKKCLGLTR